MKLFALTIFAALVAIVNAAAIDSPLLEKRCKELWVECGDDDDCCTGNCGKIPPGNTEYTCCIPASYS